MTEAELIAAVRAYAEGMTGEGWEHVREMEDDDILGSISEEPTIEDVIADITRVATEYETQERVACDGCKKQVIAPWCQWVGSMSCLCQRVWCGKCADADERKFVFNPSHMMFYKCPMCDGPKREKTDGAAV